jgi:plasmid stability protein
MPSHSNRIDFPARKLHVAHMPKMIQIRHVPDRLHRRLTARAAAAGMPLSDYLLAELEQVSAQLTPAEVRERLSALEPVNIRESSAHAIRAGRDGR